MGWGRCTSRALCYIRDGGSEYDLIIRDTFFVLFYPKKLMCIYISLSVNRENSQTRVPYNSIALPETGKKQVDKIKRSDLELWGA